MTDLSPLGVGFFIFFQDEPEPSGGSLDRRKVAIVRQQISAARELREEKERELITARQEIDAIAKGIEPVVLPQIPLIELEIREQVIIDDIVLIDDELITLKKRLNNALALIIILAVT